MLTVLWRDDTKSDTQLRTFLTFFICLIIITERNNNTKNREAQHMEKLYKNLRTRVDFRSYRTYFSIREGNKESRPDPDSR